LYYSVRRGQRQRRIAQQRDQIVEWAADPLQEPVGDIHKKLGNSIKDNVHGISTFTTGAFVCTLARVLRATVAYQGALVERPMAHGQNAGSTWEKGGNAELIYPVAHYPELDGGSSRRLFW